MNWIRDVVLIAAIMGFIPWILPAGVFEKYIKYILRLILLAALISPLTKPKAITAGLELPKEAIAGGVYEINEQNSKALDSVQSVQISEILNRRILQHVFEIVKDEFPGIREEDIEVYIEQRSLEDDRFSHCLIVIQVEDRNQSREIQALLENTLELRDVEISIQQKSMEE